MLSWEGRTPEERSPRASVRKEKLVLRSAEQASFPIVGVVPWLDEISLFQVGLGAVEETSTGEHGVGHEYLLFYDPLGDQKKIRSAHAGASSNYPVFKAPATL